jgi:hypothetical protein
MVSGLLTCSPEILSSDIEGSLRGWSINSKGQQVFLGEMDIHKRLTAGHLVIDPLPTTAKWALSA